MKRIESLALVSALAGCLLSGCGQDRLAAGEILNPPGKAAVSGTIYDAGSRPVARTVVRAYPVGYDPVADSSSPAIRGWSDTTDAEGRFDLKGLDTGLVNILAVDPATRKRLLIRGVKPGAGGNVAVGRNLEDPGTLIVPLPEAALKAESYLYIEGTPLFVVPGALSGPTPQAVFDSVPPGLTPPIRLVVTRAPRTVKDIATEVRIRPGDSRSLAVMPEWKDYARIFIGPEAQGAALTATVRAYPLLVRLDSANFPFARARPDGGDLRFTDPAGKPLAYELETWDPAARAATAWVRLDSLRPGDTARFIRMHWGNPDAAGESAGARVFDAKSPDGAYAGVWHLSAQEAGSPPAIPDASSFGNPGFVGGNTAGLAVVPTPFGRGIDFGGRGSAILTGRQFPNPGVLTLSLWFRTGTTSGGRLMGFNKWKQELDSIDFRDRHIWMGDDGRLHFAIYQTKAPPGTAKHILSTQAAFNDREWHMAAATISEAGLRFFVDGKLEGTDTTVTTGQVFDGYWRLGYESAFDDWPFFPTASSFDGVLDEARVRQRRLSDEEIRLDYETQRPGSRAARIERD